MPSKTTVTFSNDLLSKLESDVSGVVRATAERAEANAKQHAPIESGELKAKITAVRINNLTYALESNAEHSSYVEYGTVHQRAEPFFTPAIVRAKRFFEDSLRSIFK